MFLISDLFVIFLGLIVVLFLIKMSALQWALLLQAFYFLFIYWGTQSETEVEEATKVLEPNDWIKFGILGISFPPLPIIYTSLSLLYPTVWIFILLVINMGYWLFLGIKEKERRFVNIFIIGSVVLLINLKLAVINDKLVFINLLNSNTIQQITNTWESAWFLPVKILIYLVFVVGILFVLRWILREFFPNLDEKIILEKIIVAVISGVVVTGLVYLLFGDPTAATIPGLLAAASIYLFNQQRA